MADVVYTFKTARAPGPPAQWQIVLEPHHSIGLCPGWGRAMRSMLKPLTSPVADKPSCGPTCSADIVFNINT